MSMCTRFLGGMTEERQGIEAGGRGKGGPFIRIPEADPRRARTDMIGEAREIEWPP